MIFAFGHRKRQGKDEACSFLAELAKDDEVIDVLKASFADPLYEACRVLIPEFFSKAHYETYPGDKEGVIERLGRTPRQILIDVGQNLKTVLGPDCFAQALAYYISGEDLVLISDLRFPVEAEALKEYDEDCVLVKVVRPGIEVSNDPVDDAMEGWDGWDEVIVNDGTLEEYHDKLRQLYRKYMK